MTLTPETILTALSSVQDPALGQSLVSADLLRDVRIDGGMVSLTVVFVSPGYPHREEIETEIRGALESVDEVKEVQVQFVVEVPSDGHQRGSGTEPIRNAIAVASGKGGVGKSTVAVNLAVSLAQASAKVGLMDADVYGPNVPIMMGVEHLPQQSGQGRVLTPAQAHGVKLMSIGFLVKREQPMIWRGPMLHTAIQQFINDVEWGELDYLIIDLPPGTGDAQLSLAQTMALTGGLIVTLPQQVSLEDARRGLEMFRHLEVPILGVVENMSYLELPDGQKMDVFGSGGGLRLADDTGVAFIGSIPIDPAVRVGGDNGTPIVISHPDSPAAQALRAIAFDVALKASVAALRQQAQTIPIEITD